MSRCPPHGNPTQWDAYLLDLVRLYDWKEHCCNTAMLIGIACEKHGLQLIGLIDSEPIHTETHFHHLGMHARQHIHAANQTKRRKDNKASLGREQEEGERERKRKEKKEGKN